MRERVAAVLAGGLGTRVSRVTGPSTPKAMLPVDGRPFVDYKLLQLAGMGFTRVLLLTGHAGAPLRDHVADGSRWPLDIECVDDGPALLGTGGAVRAVLDRLPPRFWVTYGDSLVATSPEPVESSLVEPLRGVMTVLDNEDRWEPSNVAVEDGLVVAYEKGAPPGTFRSIDYGLLLFRGDAFAGHDETPLDLGDVLRDLVASRRLGAAAVTERLHDVGTEHGWRELDAWARDTQLWSRLGSAARAART